MFLRSTPTVLKTGRLVCWQALSWSLTRQSPASWRRTCSHWRKLRWPRAWTSPSSLSTSTWGCCCSPGASACPCRTHARARRSSYRSSPCPSKSTRPQQRCGREDTGDQRPKRGTVGSGMGAALESLRRCASRFVRRRDRQSCTRRRLKEATGSRDRQSGNNATDRRLDEPWHER